MTPGKLSVTGHPLDLALAGPGFFQVQGPNGPLYTRQGQFHRDADGHLTTIEGYPLQVQGGGDLMLRQAGDPKILEDGSVTENGELTDKLAIAEPLDNQALTYVSGSFLSTKPENLRRVRSPSVHQGMLEASNVTTGAEMVAIMGALRRAETGQRLIGVYDDLLGRVFSTMGQSG